MLPPRLLQNVPNAMASVFTSIWRRETIRKFRVKILALVRYVQACCAIAFYTRRTARRIYCHHWPYGTRAKSFAALGLAIFIAASSLNPIVNRNVMWFEVVADLKPKQASTFLDLMEIDVGDLIKHSNSTDEVTRPGSSSVSAQIYAKVGSRSVDDIPIYLADKNRDLARAFEHELKFEKLIVKIKRLTNGLMIGIGLFLGVKMFHISMRSKTVTSEQGTNLGYYFAGYYLGVHSLFVVLYAVDRYAVDRPGFLLALLLLGVTLTWVLGIIIQFWIFMNTMYRESLKRMLAATCIGAVALIVGLIVPLTIVELLLKVPNISEGVHQLAERV